MSEMETLSDRESELWIPVAVMTWVVGVKLVVFVIVSRLVPGKCTGLGSKMAETPAGWLCSVKATGPVTESVAVTDSV